MIFILLFLILFLKSAPGALIGGVLGLAIGGVSPSLSSVVAASAIFAVIHAFLQLFAEERRPSFTLTLAAAYAFSIGGVILSLFTGFDPPLRAFLLPGLFLGVATQLSMYILTPVRPHRIL